MADVPRTLPAVGPANEFFWTSGRDGRLRFLRCRECALFIHPPRPACRRCGSEQVEPEAVSGLGEVYSFTVNRHDWAPTGEGETKPYVIAIVELAEQPGLRLTTNIVDCAPEDVAVGQRVRVRFEQDGDVWVPVFAPELHGEGH